MNGSWMLPEWETAAMALEKLQNEKNSKVSSSDEKATVKTTSAGPSTTTTQSPSSYDANFYSRYYAGYQHPYAAYGMYGYGPYGPYGYMPFTGMVPQQMQPPPPPPPKCAKNEPKSESESANKQSQAASSTSSTVVSVSAAGTTNTAGDCAAEAGKVAATPSSASVTQNTWPKASTADNSSAGYYYPRNSWQPTTAGMWPRSQNMRYPRPRTAGTTEFQNAQTSPSVGSDSWQHSPMSAGNMGQVSAGAMQPSRPPVPSAMPSLRWSNSPRAGAYDGTFRPVAPKQSSEPYCPFDPTESEEYEDQAANREAFGHIAPSPDAGYFRFRIPNRGACRPMQWRQPSPHLRFSPEMQSPSREPMQRTPNWGFRQQRAPRPGAPRPGQGNVSVRPIIMPRMKNSGPRARAPWTAHTDAQKMQNAAVKSSELQESRWDKGETETNAADTVKNSAGPTTESGALNPASADDWPLPLKQFVHRCFSSVNDRDKDMMEAKLKMLLTAAFNGGTATTHDWEHEPIPDILNSSPPVRAFGSPPASDRYGRLSSKLRSPRNFKFVGSSRERRGALSSGSRRGQGRSPPGFRRRSRSRSHLRKSRSRSSSRSSSSSRHSSRSRHRRHRRRRDSRYSDGICGLLTCAVICKTGFS